MENLLLKTPNSVKFSFIKGFFDLDGHVDIHGSVVLRQGSEGDYRILRVERLLKSVNIKFKTTGISNKSLRIYSLKSYKENIGFESKYKLGHLDKYIKFIIPISTYLTLIMKY